LERTAAAALLDAARAFLGMTVHDLWIDFVALGGNAPFEEIVTMLADGSGMTSLDHDRLTVALNERLDDRGWKGLLRYWDGST
jgi:hypothetical protein